ncbi:MAG: FmdB family zinc ribbon protein [Bacteroidota bacterium]
MPTYDYSCKECGHSFEEFQSISAKPLIDCPKCGKRGLRRGLGGGSGMIFKGTGFYQTDYKNSGGNGKSATTPKKEEKPAAQPAADSKQESKPAADTPKT